MNLSRAFVACAGVLMVGPWVLSDPPKVGEAPAVATARTAETVIPGAAFYADLQVLERAYKALHPGLYRYQTPEDFDDMLAHVRGDLGIRLSSGPGEMTLRQAYLQLTFLLASIRCGHSYPNFFNQSDDVVTALFEGTNRLPFYFRWLDSKMIVTRVFEGAEDIRPGDEIVSINGEDAFLLLNELLPLARADGDNMYKRVAYLEVRGDAEFEAFDVLAPMLRPEWGASFELAVRDPETNQTRQIRAKAQSHADRAALVASQDAAKMRGEPLWEFRSLEGGVGCLRMPTWAVYNTKWDWKSWLNQRVDELIETNAPALIVDLRGNEGGNDCGDVLISRLIDKDLEQVGRVRYVCYQKTPLELDPLLNTWDDSFRDRTKETTEAPTPPLLAGGGRTFYRLAEENAGRAKVIPSFGPRYMGKVVVLIDSVCSSATFQFAQVIKETGLATLVGEPTGGNQRGLNGGAYFFMKLPNSGIEVDVPLISYISEGQTPPNDGVSPDILVKLTAKAIRKGVDPALEEAVKVARQGE